MSVRFETVFTVAASHPYYEGGRPDLDFVVPESTRRTLDGAKLLARVRADRLHVLFEADHDSGTPLLPAPGMTLRFGIRPRVASFLNVTDLAFDVGRTTALYRNGAAPGALDPLAPVRLTGERLVHTITDDPRPVTVELQTAAGDVIATDTLTAAHDRLSLSYDLLGREPGRYHVEETYPGNVQHTTTYYREPELLLHGVLAVVEVTLDAAFYGAPPAFTLAFTAKQEVLKYYVVARNYSDAEVGQLGIADLGFAADGRPEVTFDKLAAAAFTPDDIPASVLASAGKVVLFKSQAAVVRMQRPRHKIQLSRNGNVLVEQLPQPGPDRPSADVIVHLSKP
jgi:hypothetical protein